MLPRQRAVSLVAPEVKTKADCHLPATPHPSATAGHADSSCNLTDTRCLTCNVVSAHPIPPAANRTDRMTSPAKLIIAAPEKRKWIVALAVPSHIVALSPRIGGTAVQIRHPQWA